MTGVVFVKDAGSHKCLNFGGQKIWIKDASVWKEPTGVFVKHSGTWKKVYPSDLETWTSSNLPTQSSQDTSAIHSPVLATANEYQNLLVADADVTWDDGVSTTPSAYVRGWNFGWSPLSTAGFAYGAITRLEIAVQARYHGPLTVGDSISFDIGPQQGTTYNSGAVTTSLTTYTFDYTIAAWGLTAAKAAGLHSSPSSSASIQINPDYDVAAPSSTAYLHIEDLKCRIKYKYN